ncbi:ABC transporter ATP-binding protein [Bradyrhizobium sp. 2]|uniref:ABC transporter ATP-binding protein n=1 Tax=unclassified Bradyrhizobium TaxID=2631580 RepID=UPI001FF983F2|nr:MULTISPECIES: ABC transporter ATP-binding protein [unclassified Bradyrhizobium]MCK1447064.1 ABC transporter ATP-binding protein [Bradyrhizobium sp. 48]MCK1464845.1 ABC transporter ATP-binding protein [Bradyrhizobium sp. 2]
MTRMLKTTNLGAGYGKISALRNVSLEVETGEIVTVVGPNGAGKSTMLNALMGLHPSIGQIQFRGQSIERLEPEQRLRQGLCIVPEKRELFSSMTVGENLELGAFVHRKGKKSIVQESLDEVFSRFPRLKERRRQLAGTLSGGERQMLAIGRALMSRPALLMLDEPSLGLAPRLVEEMFQIIIDLKLAGVSILLIEQNARGALKISDRGYVLETGEVVLQGLSSEIMGDPRIIETYLGASRQDDSLVAQG